uniref:Aspartyl protease n=1 Tax=Candidatus Kentrum sp. FM TaxID=2126340 RepID=A0A450S346_9GAMM|nr:MAG: hypothetical protein BECKFM1743A_GA0114220_1003211 [Candidatus Kentron sp. FM]VFJ57155.1 MAG: hypothetical protein BECKFM1743C_GA0114222_101923 [Candidatus Kentron sp. FM]VFK06416.1 MAG: hypothetical protein BECKFM1743B_GA0114221_100173 [Candidatus Kentron sp. FM]
MNALVDTGASYLTFPLAWKEKLGAFRSQRKIELQTATQEIVKAIICGPVEITVEGFRPVYNELLFLDMIPDKGKYEPLLGYVVLEQCGVSVELSEHRLVPMKYMDAKFGGMVKGRINPVVSRPLSASSAASMAANTATKTKRSKKSMT